MPLHPIADCSLSATERADLLWLRDRVLAMMINFRLILTFLFIFSFSGLVSAADEDNHPLLHKTVFGIFLHDRGPASDRHESGVDPNWEIQFNAPKWKQWQWIGSPYPMIGVTPNFKGDTSVFYGGLNYEFSLSNKLTNKLTYSLTKDLGRTVT